MTNNKVKKIRLAKVIKCEQWMCRWNEDGQCKVEEISIGERGDCLDYEVGNIIVKRMGNLTILIKDKEEFKGVDLKINVEE